MLRPQRSSRRVGRSVLVQAATRAQDERAANFSRKERFSAESLNIVFGQTVGFIGETCLSVEM